MKPSARRSRSFGPVDGPALRATYRDLGLGVVDASIIALAERLDEPKVATLDHRHFGVVRPVHVDALRLVPAVG